MLHHRLIVGRRVYQYYPQSVFSREERDFFLDDIFRSPVKNKFVITENTAFEEVIFNCKNIVRKDGFGTWITNDMEQAYINLHKKGVAKSIEDWRFLDDEKREKELVGGLYGLEINNIFCGESMFSKVSNASKLAFIHLAKKKKYKLIDCQIYNEHLASLGAKEIDRDSFLGFLQG